MVNKVELIGRLGAEPEVKVLEGGTRLTKISVGTSKSWKDKDGNKKEETQWHNVSFFGKVAENAERMLRKGSLVFIDGELKYSVVENPDGTKRKFTDINARDFRILADGKKNENANANSGGASTPAPNPVPVGASTNATSDDDDLPF